MSRVEGIAPVSEAVRTQAAEWFARMRGPEAEVSRAAFETWRSSPENARAYERLSARWEQSAFIGATPTGRGRRLRRAPLVVRHPAVSAVAALVALIVTAALCLPLVGPGRHARSTIEVAARARFETSAAPRVVTLRDGSRLTLDRASRVNIAYSPEARTFILEQGKARFDVAHEAHRGFRVLAGATEITAHGTLFDVALNKSVATVTLLKGAISVRSRNRPGPAKVLHPGQQIIVSSAAPLPEATAAPADVDAWLPAMISFHDTALADAAFEIARGSDLHIIVSADAAAHRISGAFRVGDADAFARTAAIMFGLSLDRSAANTLRLSAMPKPAAK